MISSREPPASSQSWKAAVDRALGRSNHEEDDRKLESVERSVILATEGANSGAATMDPEIWSNLPSHLLESVLAWLPITSLLKLRCVCKRFNNVLYSPSLWATCRRRVRGVAAWYLFRGEGRECAAFNPEADSWCKLPLGFLPWSSKGRVVAAAGGLLCVRQGDHMIVCNPVSKAWLELPKKKNSWKFPIVGTSITPLLNFLTLSVKQFLERIEQNHSTACFSIWSQQSAGSASGKL